jgi:hypothetical protein
VAAGFDAPGAASGTVADGTEGADGLPRQAGSGRSSREVRKTVRGSRLNITGS